MRTRFLRRVEPALLNADLARADWSAVFSAATVTQKWDSFVAIFMPVVNAHAPVRTIRIRNPSAPTVSDATKVLMCRRRGALEARDEEDSPQVRVENLRAFPKQLCRAQPNRQGRYDPRPLNRRAERRQSRLGVDRFDEDLEGFQEPFEYL